MKELSIILDKTKYHPGDTINGIVCFLLDREKRLKRIRLRIEGKAQVKCTQNEDGANVGSALISSDEIYFEDSTLLVSTDAAHSTLASGEHSLPFKFHLPENIPSSFEGSYGTVRYTFECSIISPLKATKSIRKTISIQNPIRLSDHPYAPLPWKRDIRMNLGGVACIPGSITASLHIPHRGIIPGDKIYFSAKIANNSGRQFSTVKFTLYMIVRYESQSDATRSNVQVIKLNRSQKGSVGPGESEVWSDESLIVPHYLPASDLENCSIIHIGYYIEMYVQARGPFPALRIPSKTPRKPTEFNVIVGSEY